MFSNRLQSKKDTKTIFTDKSFKNEVNKRQFENCLLFSDLSYQFVY
jgi:hypothetical protein